MRYFRLQPALDDDSSSYRIQAAHRWRLPGVVRDVCGVTWANSGTSYPALNLPASLNDADYAQREPVSRAALQALREPLRRVLPSDAPLPPGTEFGPLVGSTLGSLPDIAWVEGRSSDLLLRRETLERLRDVGARGLRGVGPRVLPSSQAAPTLLELDIPLAGRLHGDSFKARRPRYVAEYGMNIEIYADDELFDPLSCTACGRLGGSIRRIVLERSEAPDDLDIFRPRNAATVVVVTERFTEALCRLGVTGAALDADVSVAD